MNPKTEKLTSGAASEELEFKRMYQEMERSHIKPLWTDEAKILPRTPSRGPCPGSGNGRSSTGSRAARAIW